MDAKRIRQIAEQLEGAEHGTEYTDLAVLIADLEVTDWRRKVLERAFQTAFDHLIKAREGFCALANALGNPLDADSPQAVNRLGHWACDDTPDVFADSVPLPHDERPTMF